MVDMLGDTNDHFDRHGQIAQEHQQRLLKLGERVEHCGDEHVASDAAQRIEVDVRGEAHPRLPSPGDRDEPGAVSNAW
jgi:hypothetical protein